MADPISIAKKQDDPTGLQPVPKSWKPVLASRLDGSPVLIAVPPKVHDAILEAAPESQWVPPEARDPKPQLNVEIPPVPEGPS
jgi:hypothetical protein